MMMMRITAQPEQMAEILRQPVGHRLCDMCLACRWPRRSFYSERILFLIIINSVTSSTLDYTSLIII